MAQVTPEPTTPGWPKETRAGLDLGSRTAKLAVVGPGGVVSTRLLDSVPFLLSLRERGFNPVDLGLDPAWPLVTTGYGKKALANGTGISEVRAHFRGALLQSGLADFVLVELGGQDSKIVAVSGGRPVDFLTNDRCAAGTGRYLENMARLLGVGLDELSRSSDSPVGINNTCAIFGETELLGHLAEGRGLSSIMAGVNLSVARRVAQMVRRFKPQTLVFCGGVAKNQAVVGFTAELLGCRVFIPPEPQLNGAIGCCLEQE